MTLAEIWAVMDAVGGDSTAVGGRQDVTAQFEAAADQLMRESGSKRVDFREAVEKMLRR